MMDFNQSEERVDGRSTASQEVNLAKEQVETIIIDCSEVWKESINNQISEWEFFTGKEFFNKNSQESVDIERIVCDVDDDISDWKWECTIDCRLDVYSDSDSAEIKVEKSVDSDEKIEMIDKIAKAVIEKFLSGEYCKEVDNG